MLAHKKPTLYIRTVYIVYNIGAAYICLEIEIEKQITIPKSASIFTAECIALSSAHDVALQTSSSNFLIFTDSQSALLSLKSTDFKAKVNPHILDIKKEYNEFCSKNKDNYIQFY